MAVHHSSKLKPKYLARLRRLRQDFPEAHRFLESVGQSIGPTWLSTSTNAHLYVKDRFLCYLVFTDTPYGKGLLVSAKKHGLIADGAVESSELLLPDPLRELIASHDGFGIWASVESHREHEAFVLMPAPEREGCERFFASWLDLLGQIAKGKQHGQAASSAEEGAEACDHIVRCDQLEWTEQSHGERYSVRRKQLGAAAGASKLGASLYEVPPGKSAWPKHAHLANEEAIFVLAGTGLLELGSHEHRVEPGDYIALPAGKSNAHRLTNNGDGPLRYLCTSTMEAPDVMLYPDSDKVGVFAGAAPGGDKDAREFSGFFRLGDRVGYWEGE